MAPCATDSCFATLTAYCDVLGGEGVERLRGAAATVDEDNLGEAPWRELCELLSRKRDRLNLQRVRHLTAARLHLKAVTEHLHGTPQNFIACVWHGLYA